MLVESNQCTKGCRIKDIKHQTRTRAVALEDLALNQCLAGIGSELLPDLFLGLAEREGLGLSKEVGEEDTMVFGIRDWVVSVSGCKEVRGNDFCALVDELVEGVLAVRARSTPDNRLGDGLAVRTFEEY